MTFDWQLTRLKINSFRQPYTKELVKILFAIRVLYKPEQTSSLGHPLYKNKREIHSDINNIKYNKLDRFRFKMQPSLWSDLF